MADVALPLRVHVATPQTRRTSQAPAGSRPAGGMPHVLVAEDEPFYRDALDGLLRGWGCRVTAVADGQAALRAAASDPSINLAILNWMLPGVDGADLCRRLGERAGRNIYTILLTGRRYRQEALAAAGNCVDDCLVKPFGPLAVRRGLQQAREALAARKAALTQR